MAFDFKKEYKELYKPEVTPAIDRFLTANGFVKDFTEDRRHHGIYLSDPGKCCPEKMKTVI